MPTRVAVVASLAVLIGLLVATVPPASAAGSLRLQASPSPVLARGRVTLRAVVSPHRRGRPVVFSRRSGGRWVTIGSARTSRTGVARLTARFSRAGRQKVRALAKRFRGAGQRSDTAIVTVVAPHFVQLTAPSQVDTGSTFDVGVKVSATPFPLRHAVLTLTAPSVGSQVKPPKDWSVDPKTHTATLAIGNLAKGVTRTFPLRWQAPGAEDTLPFKVALTATGVTETHRRSTMVVAPGADSFRFDGDLRTTGQSRTRGLGDHSYYRSCTTQVPARTTLGFTATLSAIDDFTYDGTSTDAWRALDLAHHPERADDVAGIAMGADRPAAALAAVVQGWRDHPNDGVFLNDAAALSNVVLHPEWAIALEQKAGGLDISGSTGISNRAIRLANLGHAHAMMGDWAAAKGLLTQAVALEPGGSQLNQELAAISYCAGDQAGASKQFRRSLRPAGSPDDDVQLGNPPTSSRPSASKLWDLSLATAPVVEIPEIPQTPADLVAERGSQRGDGFWVDEYWRLNDRMKALHDQESQLRAQLAAEDLQPVSRQQITDILWHLTSEASLGKLDDDAMAASGDASLWCPVGNDAQFCGGQFSNKDCGLNQSAFDAWHIEMNAWRDAVGAYIAAAWRIGSGVRANLSDPVAWQLAGVLLEDRMTLSMQGIVQEVWYASNAMPTADNDDNPCWTTPPQDPPPTQTRVTGAEGTICAPDSLAARVSLAVEGEFGSDALEGVGWSIKQSCSSTDYEADLNPIPFLSGFTKASFNTDGSGVTFFLGAKASASVPGSASSFESSLYVTLDGHGKVTDFGWDVGPEGETGAGPVKIQTFSDHVRISFMSLFTDTPATF